MKPGYERTKVLITVTTYPLPSEGYQELVCTAGVTEAGEWVRLYPVPLRYLDQLRRYRKYQWIEVDLAPIGHGNDTRKESRRPDLDSIRVLGERLSTKDDWRERRDVIDRLPHQTLNEYKALHKAERVSLGVVRPKRILDLMVKRTTGEWKAKWKRLFEEERLLGDDQKPLAKIPHTFHYVFECDDSDKPHRAMNEDWELGMLFLRERAKGRTEDEAIQSVRRRFFDEMCAPSRDTCFFMGTVTRFNTWLVLGVFWPPKTDPQLPGLLQ